MYLSKSICREKQIAGFEATFVAAQLPPVHAAKPHLLRGALCFWGDKSLLPTGYDKVFENTAMPETQRN